MGNTLKVALAQLNPAQRDVSKNTATICRLLTERSGADLIVFPELFLSGYTVFNVGELAVDLDDPELERIAQAARETSTGVIFGAPERFEIGYANSAFYIDANGMLAGVYRKTHLFDAEREAYLPGDELLTFNLAELRIGLLICFDMEFPETARKLAQAGVDLFITISACWVPFGRDHAVFSTARALENGLPHVYVNQIGEGEEFPFTGGSMIVSADGDHLIEAGMSEEMVIDFELELPKKSSIRPNYLKQVRSPLLVRPTFRTPL